MELPISIGLHKHGTTNTRWTPKQRVCWSRFSVPIQSYQGIFNKSWNHQVIVKHPTIKLGKCQKLLSAQKEPFLVKKRNALHLMYCKANMATNWRHTEARSYQPYNVNWMSFVVEDVHSREVWRPHPILTKMDVHDHPDKCHHINHNLSWWKVSLRYVLLFVRSNTNLFSFPRKQLLHLVVYCHCISCFVDFWSYYI